MPVRLLTLWEQAPTACFLAFLGLSMRHSSISPGTMVSAYTSLDFSIPLTLELSVLFSWEKGCPHKYEYLRLEEFYTFGLLLCCVLLWFGFYG